jgi:hypothetical protein
VHCKTNVQMQILVASGALCRERVLQLFVELQSFESVCARSKVKRRVVQRVDLTHYGRLCLSLKFRCLGTMFGFSAPSVYQQVHAFKTVEGVSVNVPYHSCIRFLLTLLAVTKV